MVTNPEYSECVKKFKSTQLSSKLSMPALETLSIIAYKQPIIKAEIEQLRGVNSDSAIRTLLEKRLIKVIGRKEAPGRPFLYGTTREFLQYFGLKDLTELPTLKDLIREEAA
jgi:segregation and condensation protein B